MADEEESQGDKMAEVEESLLTDKGGQSIKVKKYKGRLWPSFPEESIKGVTSFKIRDDDVIIVNYPKSGTHWIWEIVRILMAGTTDIPKEDKVARMIEFGPPGTLPDVPSPRALSTHAHFELMPREVLSVKTCKVVYVTRDPRDVAVSFFNHHVKMPWFYFYEGKWEDYFPLFLSGEVDYESWFAHTRGWERGMTDNPDLQVHVTSYEALQKDTMKETEKLAIFLGAPTDEAFLSAVIERTSFDTMRAANIRNTPVREGEPPADPVMFRKGKVGDWKNWFTEAQAEQFDAVFEQEMKGTKAHGLYSGHRDIPQPK